MRPGTCGTHLQILDVRTAEDDVFVDLSRRCDLRLGRAVLGAKRAHCTHGTAPAVLLVPIRMLFTAARASPFAPQCLVCLVAPTHTLSIWRKAIPSPPSKRRTILQCHSRVLRVDREERPLIADLALTASNHKTAQPLSIRRLQNLPHIPPKKKPDTSLPAPLTAFRSSAPARVDTHLMRQIREPL